MNKKSKWFDYDNNLIAGNRGQWTKDNSYISIDIANFVDDIDAQNFIEKVSKDSNTQIFLSSKTNFIQKYVDEWVNKWNVVDTLKYLSIFSNYNNKTIHFYFHNNGGINVNLIHEIANKLYRYEKQ